MNNENKFVVIGRERCGYCDAAKKFLRSKEEDFRYLDSGLMEPEELASRLDGLRVMTFPIVFYKGKYIGGFKELSEKYGDLIKEEHA